MFINDIEDTLNLPVTIFADDLVFYCDANDISEGLKNINECFKRLSDWCKDNDLTINASKTKVMQFYKANDYRAKNLLGTSVSLNGTDIEVVNVFKYLGVQIDSVLSYADHYLQVEKRLTNAMKRMYSLRRFFTERIIKIFISCYAVSIVDYCLCVWSTQTSNQLDRLQNKINSFLFDFFYPKYYRKKGVRCHLVINDLLKKINLMTIEERRKIFLLKFIVKADQITIFDKWFVRRVPPAESKISKFIVPKINSERYKNSVVWSAIEVWNGYYQIIKPSDVITYNVFIEKCKTLVIQERDKT